MIHKAAAIILSGGQSKRMGQDKAFISFSGKPLIETVIGKLAPLFSDLIIATNKPDLYKKYKVKTQTDIVKSRGPLGGIHAGLIASETTYNFIIACDMPFINQDLIKYMLDEKDNYDVVASKFGGKTHSLFAVYSKNCITSIEKALKTDNFKLRDFLKTVNTKLISEEEVKRIDPDGQSFININTQDDYKCITKNHLKK